MSNVGVVDAIIDQTAQDELLQPPARGAAAAI